MPSSSGYSRVTPTAIVLASVFIIFWMTIGSMLLPGSRDHDFLCAYLGGTMAREGRFADLHNPEAQMEREQKIVPGITPLRPFIRPPFFSLILAPMTVLPLQTAYNVWLTFFVSLLLLCWFWATRRFGQDALVLGSLYLPACLGIAYGQDCVLFLAIVMLSYWLLDVEHDFASGCVLALGLAKFHLFLLYPVWMLLQRRWKMFAGFCSVGALLIGVSVEISGIEGLVKYAALLQRTDIQELGPGPETMVNIYSFWLNFGIDQKWLMALTALTVFGFAVVGMRRPERWRSFSVAAVGSLLLAPHVYVYDMAILLLPVWLTIFYSRTRLSRFAALGVSSPSILIVFALRPPFRAIPSVLIMLLLTALLREKNQAQPAAPASSLHDSHTPNFDFITETGLPG